MARSPGEIYDEAQRLKALNIEKLNLANTEVVEKVLTDMQALISDQAQNIETLGAGVLDLNNRVSALEELLQRAYAESQGNGSTELEPCVDHVWTSKGLCLHCGVEK